MENIQANLLRDIVHFLDAKKIPYMITGSWSSIYYGRPRASHDIDFVIELHCPKGHGFHLKINVSLFPPALNLVADNIK